MAAGPSKISAVIRTKNSERTLPKTLCSIRAQDESVAEIIVVDSGSTDDTRRIAERYGCRWVSYPQGRPFNFSLALNIGIEQASGERVLIISSHTVFAYKDTLRTMQTNLERNSACAAYCDAVWKSWGIPKRSDPLRAQLTEVVFKDNFHGTNGLSNTCSLIERECWKRHPFDETMPSAEDQEWANWFYKNENKVTVRIRNAGVIYLNQNYNWRKEVRDRGVVANRLNHAMHGWREIGRFLGSSASCLLRGKAQDGQKYFCMAFELLLSRYLKERYRC